MNYNQEWQEVIFKKQAKQKQHNVFTEEQAKQCRLQNETDVPELKKSTKEDRQWIIDGRVKKGLTQKALATQMNVRFDIIQNIESGKALPDGNLKNKLKRFYKS